VPVCPLCSAPIPIARGTVPDLAVSAHIDQGCPEKKKKEKVFYHSDFSSTEIQRVYLCFFNKNSNHVTLLFLA